MPMQPDELRAIRKGLGMTQNDMAEAIGLSSTLISLMEGGKAPIEPRTERAVLALHAAGSARRMFDHMIGLRDQDLRSIELMEQGTFRGHLNGKDVTDEWIADARRRVSEIEPVIAEAAERHGFEIPYRLKEG